MAYREVDTRSARVEVSPPSNVIVYRAMEKADPRPPRELSRRAPRRWTGAPPNPNSFARPCEARLDPQRSHPKILFATHPPSSLSLYTEATFRCATLSKRSG